MKSELLFDNFEMLLDSHNSVDKIRKFILGTAVKGKLVPQDSSDEHASVLLEKITTEKKKLIKEKKIRKEKPLPPIEEDEISYELPKGWMWARLGKIFTTTSGGTPSRVNPAYWEGPTPWLKSGELNDDTNITKAEESITEEGLKNSSAKLFEKGSVVLALYGATAGKLGILGFNTSTNQAVCNFSKTDFIETKYLFHFLMASRPKIISNCFGGAQPNISQDYVKKIIFPLPPLAEQKRIVEKVDGLMKLCDELDLLKKHKSKQHKFLVKSATHRFSNAKNAEDIKRYGKIMSENFHSLYTDLESIKSLRQLILQEAVSGKLVPHDPSDEPASVLLEKIKVEKEKLIKEKKIRKEKPLPPIEEDEIPYELPKEWEWVKLQEAIDVRDGTHDTPKYVEEGVPLITSRCFDNGKINFEIANKISLDDHNNIKKRSLVEEEDILFSMIGGNIGNMVKVDTEREFSIKNVALFKYYSKELTLPDYLYIFLKHLATVIQEKSAGGAQPFISLTYFRNQLLSLPPLAEQKRIVEKVDRLMKLCDKLEMEVRENQKNAELLMDSVLRGAFGYEA